ncbi:hypothetical protein APSETT444_004848 [Aspergillus pseudonomiae]
MRKFNELRSIISSKARSRHSDEPSQGISPNSTHTNQTEQRASQRISPIDNDNNRKLISVHEDLWNRAYKELKADPGKEKYIKAYEQLVSDIFLGRPTNSSACAEPIHGPRRDTDNTPWTEDQLQHIIQKGLERVNASQKRIDSTSEVFGVVQNLKPIFNAVLGNTPHTALPWAIVSSTIDILANPVRSTKALYDGVNHVVDRMQWYSKITDSLLQNGSNNSHRKLEEVRKQLETENALRSDLQQYKLEQILTILDQMAINNKTHDGADDEYRQCLKSLGVVNPMLRTKDIIARKNEVLKGCYKWVFQTKAYQDFIEWQFKDMPNLLWIQGQAGTGKTMLLAGIMEELNTTPANSVSPTALHFSFQDKDGQVDQSLMAVKSLLWLLLSQYPYLVQYVHQEAQSSQGNLFDGEYAFTVTCDLIKTMLQDDNIDPVIVILDGLDECEYKARTRLINFLGSLLQLNSADNVRVKVLISSRPLEEIKTAVNGIKSTIPRATLAVDNISLEGPITAFIEWNIDRLEESTEDKTLLLTIRRELRKRASNTFLWVSLVCQELNHYGLHMWENILGEIPDGLVELYDKLLAMLEGSKYKRHVQTCKMVLTISILARRPLSLDELALLAQIGEGMIRSIVHDCRSFLTIQGDTVYLFHQSVQDYLQDNYCRLQDKPCEYIHRSIFSLSLKTMEDKLQRNMYKLPYAGSTIDDSRLPDPDPLRAIRYSCRFWVHHLKHSDSMYDASEMIYSFFQKHFLHWLEAMSLMHMVPGSIRMMDDLKPLTTIKIETEAEIGAVILSPDFQLLAHTRRDKTIKIWRSSTGALMQTLVDHLGSIEGVLAFSPGNDMLASGSRNSLRLWKIAAQEPVFAFPYSGSVKAVAFSRDGSLVASGGSDCMIRLWNTREGHLEQILQGHGSIPICLSFSVDDQVLASGSQDLTLKLWDLTQGTRDPARDSEQVQPQLNSQPDMIATIDISPDEQQVAAGSWGGVVTLWDLKTGKLQYTLKHTRSCTHVVFTPDSQQVVWGGFDKGNHVCNAKSGSYEGETVTRPALLRLERESSTRKPEVLFENGWVVAASSGQRILWLPPEYRPTYWVDWKCIEHGNMLICGTDTGHIHFYEFQMEGDLT